MKMLTKYLTSINNFKFLLQAYRKWVREHWEEPRLAGMMLTNEQVFFISFARVGTLHTRVGSFGLDSFVLILFDRRRGVNETTTIADHNNKSWTHIPSLSPNILS